MPENSAPAPAPRPTHSLAVSPVIAPAASVDGFVKQFLQNLNFDQGVALSASHVNDRYLALAIAEPARRPTTSAPAVRTIQTTSVTSES